MFKTLPILIMVFTLVGICYSSQIAEHWVAYNSIPSQVEEYGTMDMGGKTNWTYPMKVCDYCGEEEASHNVIIIEGSTERKVCLDCWIKALDKVLGKPIKILPPQEGD